MAVLHEAETVSFATSKTALIALGSPGYVIGNQLLLLTGTTTDHGPAARRGHGGGAGYPFTTCRGSHDDIYGSTEGHS